MFSQKALEAKYDKMHAISGNCDGCDKKCLLTGITYLGIWHPCIGKIIKTYIDPETYKKVIILPRTCGSAKAAYELAKKIALTCDHHKKNRTK